MRDGYSVVLTNYARPENMEGVIRSWREQSVAPREIVVFDNSPYGPSTNARSYLRADDVWSACRNYGCPGRIAVAAALTGPRHVVIADDDLVPGVRAIEDVLNTIKTLDDRFSSIGGSGRAFSLDAPAGHRYSYGSPSPGMVPTRVDLCCRCKVVRADYLPLFFEFRENLLAAADPSERELIEVHDDLMLDLGIQNGMGYPSYLQRSVHAEARMISRELPAPTAICKRNPRHLQDRNRMLDLCIRAGWRRPT